MVDGLTLEVKTVTVVIVVLVMWIDEWRVRMTDNEVGSDDGIMLGRVEHD